MPLLFKMKACHYFPISCGTFTQRLCLVVHVTINSTRWSVRTDMTATNWSIFWICACQGWVMRKTTLLEHRCLLIQLLRNQDLFLVQKKPTCTCNFHFYYNTQLILGDYIEHIGEDGHVLPGTTQCSTINNCTHPQGHVTQCTTLHTPKLQHVSIPVTTQYELN